MNDYDVGGAFAQIEEELIASMIRNMKRHKVEEIDQKKQWTQWQAEQLKSLARYKEENKELFRGRFEEINNSIDDAIMAARKQGNMDQELEVLNAIKNGFRPTRSDNMLQAQFFKLNDRKLNALIQETKGSLRSAETAILRMADDKYRKVIFNAQVYANTGAGTYEKAIDMATKDYLNAGLNCIEYKNGHRVTLETYASMALRTASKRAYLTGEGEKRKEWGITTVILNRRTAACPKCLPFEGKVFIDDVWSGGKAKDGSYPLLSTAIAKGLYHPNCRDSHTTYFPGVSEPPRKPTKAEAQESVDSYNKEQQQNYFQNNTERMGRLAKHSIDKDNKTKYKERAEQWKEKVESISNRGIIEEGNTKDKGVDILIDEFTPCLIERQTEKIIETVVKPIKFKQVAKLKEQGWKFDWTKPYSQGNEVYQLNLKDNEQIEGMIALSKSEASQGVYIDLVETAPHNYGSRGKYKGVGAHLFAYGCKKAYDSGMDCVFFDAKSSLVDYYAKSFGARQIGASQRMIVEGNAFYNLIKRYYGKEKI